MRRRRRLSTFEGFFCGCFQGSLWAGMAGVSRHIARSFISSSRFFATEMGATRPTGLGTAGARAAAAAPRSAASSGFSSSPRSFFSESRRPCGFFGRLPGELACVQSFLPLHNATASARLVSQLRSSAGTLLQDGEDGT